MFNEVRTKPVCSYTNLTKLINKLKLHTQTKGHYRKIVHIVTNVEPSVKFIINQTTAAPIWSNYWLYESMQKENTTGEENFGTNQLDLPKRNSRDQFKQKKTKKTYWTIKRKSLKSSEHYNVSVFFVCGLIQTFSWNANNIGGNNMKLHMHNMQK